MAQVSWVRRIRTWDLGSLRYAAAQVGDVALMIVLSTKHPAAAAAATRLLKIAVSHL